MSISDTKRRILEISTEYAEACADCELLRRTEAYPYTEWRAAWERLRLLQSELMAEAIKLTKRPTGSGDPK